MTNAERLELIKELRFMLWHFFLSKDKKEELEKILFEQLRYFK